MKWTTKEGKEIEVADMDDTHVTNTVNMLMKTNNPRALLNTLLLGVQKAREINNKHSRREIEPQGDMAQMFNETNEWEDMGTYDPYWD